MTFLFFFIFAGFALAGAAGVVVLRNPFYCVLALIVHLISLALLFLLLEAQFVAVAQIVVYAGAVMVLYVFVVAYVGGGDKPDKLWSASPRQKALAICFASLIFIELAIAILGTALSSLGTEGVKLSATYGTPAEIGELLLTDYLLAFELASMLLLVAAIGAVALAGRRGGIAEDEGNLSPRHGAVHTPSPAATGSMAEGVSGYGVTTPLPEPQFEGRELQQPARAAAEDDR